MIITFDDTTIKHLMYTQKVPFQYTESFSILKETVWFFAVLKFTLEKNDVMKSVASFKDQREYRLIQHV